MSLALAGYFGFCLVGSDRSAYLPGKTSHGHYQIELKCDACHTPGQGVKQDACAKCHGEELKLAKDSHPESKFNDPRNADRVALLDARKCITCHQEHRPEQTRPMGVTLPDDFCAQCHAGVGEERPSHKEFGFQTCASAGCHNFHDNTALYEDFLAKHLHEPEIMARAQVPLRTESANAESRRPLTAADQDAPASVGAEAGVLHDWQSTAHARAGVNCSGCHQAAGSGTAGKRWVERPDHTACKSCHESEVDGFLAGKHGMRLAEGLHAMKVADARQPMRTEASRRAVTCGSCHGAHRFDTKSAAVEGCLGCHNDDHSRAFEASPHARLWKAEASGSGPAGSGVSCATCHLPRGPHQDGDSDRVAVQHNQNANLRPNEKMVRSVCMHCHGLGFSLDALADSKLVQNNFNGRPARHNSSLDLAAARLKQQGTRGE